MTKDGNTEDGGWKICRESAKNLRNNAEKRLTHAGGV